MVRMLSGWPLASGVGVPTVVGLGRFFGGGCTLGEAGSRTVTSAELMTRVKKRLCRGSIDRLENVSVAAPGAAKVSVNSSDFTVASGSVSPNRYPLASGALSVTI